ncbi:hypothetical protein [Fimbriimonas ginsengisoli]|uniref:Uncharacterized protein n=1 Tax=Fimbriimonas ginsengisoli Gsoil 348 TaxID=661478 RepID=A0A068NLM8_FIMGI|nr:hypothetical protein [Fimbriimonas ginsengisoli]AIE84322.1 hypothetical protein OP10G_0954 [Fimbriimonas ginsengisoli Gsoil 348]
MPDDAKPKPSSVTVDTAAPVETTSSVDITSPRPRRRDPLVVKDISEVLRSIETCRHSQHGRGITAILRIVREQLKARMGYQEPAFIFWFATFFVVALLGVGFVGKQSRAFSMAAVLASLGLVNGVWWLKGRRVAWSYNADRKAIRQAAVEGITYLYVRGHHAKRLYRDDVYTLQDLAKGHPEFKRTMKEIVDAAERS